MGAATARRSGSFLEGPWRVSTLKDTPVLYACQSGLARNAWRRICAEIVIPSSPLFSRWIEHALDVAVQCPHDADPRKHRRAAELDHQHHWANFMVETGHLPS